MLKREISRSQNIFNILDENSDNGSWSWIWRLKFPKKYKFLVWLACHNVVPTLALLNHRNMATSSICSRCGDHEESFLHCVRDCSFLRIIWQKYGFVKQAFFSSSSPRDWIKEGASCPRSTIFLAGLWWTSRHHNLMCLGNETWPVTGLNMNIITSVDDISSCLQSVSSANPPPRLVRWNNNSHVHIILNVDGSCIGDPIRTGFGGILRNHSGTYLSSFSGFINNSKDILFAELKAIYQGLNLAISLGVEELACYSDPLLAVNLINGDTSQYHISINLIWC